MADEQPVPDGEREEQAGDAAREFAQLMSQAHAAANPGAGEPRWGYTTDRVTGERRPKKAAGAPKGPRIAPGLDELKAARAEGGAAPVGEDQAPAGKHKRGRHDDLDKPPDDDKPPPYTPGVIAKGVNRLYRRAGKIARAMDHDIGTAIIEATRNTAEPGEPDDSVGAAWEEVARVNPRIRRFLLKAIAGGAWGQLVMAHAPIFLAIFMKEKIRERIPWMKFVTALTEPDDDAAPGEKAQALTPDDLQQMMSVAQGFMSQMAQAQGFPGKAAA